MSFWTASSLKRRPIKRLIANNVFLGLVTAWRFADWPTNTSSSLLNAMIEGVVRAPSLFSITFATPFSNTATHELVVPKSMPIILAIEYSRMNLFNYVKSCLQYGDCFIVFKSMNYFLVLLLPQPLPGAVNDHLRCNPFERR